MPEEQHVFEPVVYAFLTFFLCAWGLGKRLGKGLEDWGRECKIGEEIERLGKGLLAWGRDWKFREGIERLGKGL